MFNEIWNPADNHQLVCEFSSETLHGEEAFQALFGWGDHRWLRDALK